MTPCEWISSLIHFVVVFSISDETILHQQMHIVIHINIMHLNVIHVLAICAESNVCS